MFTPEYLLGLFFIVLVALIWAASSVVAQLVYSSDSFDSPFLLTYMGTSLFTLWLPIHFSTEWCTKVKSSSSDSENNNNIGSNSELLNSTHYESVGRESPVHSDGEEEEDEDEANNMQQLSPVDSPPLRQQEEAWTNEDHFRVALRIAPVWFIANWAYNASLLYTTITSSTVLASTSALFTFIFAVLCKDESFLMIKLAGVLLGVSGGILTALHDASADKDHMDDPSNTKNGDEQDPLFLLGDLLGILSAVGYGAYAVQTRIFCPKDESLYSMQVLLGYIGLLNMTVLSPVAIYIMMSSSHVELVVLGCVLLKGLFDNFLRYAWQTADGIYSPLIPYMNFLALFSQRLSMVTFRPSHQRHRSYRRFGAYHTSCISE